MLCLVDIFEFKIHSFALPLYTHVKLKSRRISLRSGVPPLAQPMRMKYSTRQKTRSSLCRMLGAKKKEFLYFLLNKKKQNN